jgi:8-oxo-dGTP diphosphatase
MLYIAMRLRIANKCIVDSKCQRRYDKHMKKVAENPAHLHFAVLAVDVALFTIHDNQLMVRLVGVHRPPFFTNTKGLPGGLIDPKETAEESVSRHIDTKAKISPEKIYIEQLYTFSEIDRDPRGRVVAVAYLALVAWDKLSAAERADTADAWWSPIRGAENLAYDHDDILHMAIKRLRSRATYTTLIKKLMPQEFTLTELEHTYETLLKSPLDKRNFRKKILKLGIITQLPHKRKSGAFRPAQLYKFSSDKVHEIEVL